MTDPADRCSWCGHLAHAEACTRTITTGTARKPNPIPCPCKRHLKGPAR